MYFLELIDCFETNENILISLIYNCGERDVVIVY